MKRHELDWFSLVAGAVFMVVAVTQLVDAATDASVDLGWLFPVGLVALGAAGLAGALRGGDRQGRQADVGLGPAVPVGESPEEPRSPASS